MKYISIFSGIEAASVAWEPLGWEPLAFAEVDPFPSAVLAERWPEVPNLGDVTKIDWGEVVRNLGRPDVLVGGSPCQSFSVAGNRESLEGESRLMFEYIRAVTELQPRWFLWENVPGCLNTRDDAFGQLLKEMEDGGYKDLAYRVLDAQFCRVPVWDDRGNFVGWFGPVAQRRRRVFLVGHLGEGFRAAAVLFEPESVRGDNPSSREKRKELTAYVGEGTKAESRGESLAFKFHQGSRAGTMPVYDDGSVNTVTSDWHSPAVAMQTGHTKGNGSGINQDDVSYTLSRANDHAIAFYGDTTPKASDEISMTLRRGGEGGTNIAVAFAQNNRMEVRLKGGSGDHVGAIAAHPDFTKGQGGSLICTTQEGENANQNCLTPWDVQSKQVFTPESVSPTLNAGGNNWNPKNVQPIVLMASGQANAEISGEQDPSPALAARQHKNPPILIDRAAFNQGENAKYPPHIEKTELSDALVARGPHAVAYRTDRGSEDA